MVTLGPYLPFPNELPSFFRRLGGLVYACAGMVWKTSEVVEWTAACQTVDEVITLGVVPCFLFFF